MSKTKARGVYDVTESGVKYRDLPGEEMPKDGPDFLDKFKQKFQMNILEHDDPNELVFEMIGIDVSLANALRRIMIAEVSTMAIEHVYMWQNSSIMHDEVLAHRLGLVPIMVDPRLFEAFDDDGTPTDRNTLVFRLAVSCNRPPTKPKQMARISNTIDQSVAGNDLVDQAAEDAASSYHGKIADIEIPDRPYTKHVYSGDLQWVPQGDQASRFPDGIRPVHDDILLAKLRPGQTIELEAHARLGDGKDHGKYSPVATACYRLMPVVELLKDVYDELADELDKYEPGVFDIVPCDDGVHKRKAVVINPYACTMSRNFMRNPILKESVKITRKSDHFIFSIESVGMLPAAVILAESLLTLKRKCQNVIRLAEEAIEAEIFEK